MRFPMPWLPAGFEIPDDWWAEAQATDFRPSSAMYPSAPAGIAIPLQEIQPPVRNPQRPMDFAGFDRARMVQALQGMVYGAALPPVELRTLPASITEEFGTQNPYGFRVYDGYHRFYASVALTFTHLPGIIL